MAGGKEDLCDVSVCKKVGKLTWGVAGAGRLGSWGHPLVDPLSQFANNVTEKMTSCLQNLTHLLSPGKDKMSFALKVLLGHHATKKLFPLTMSQISLKLRVT